MPHALIKNAHSQCLWIPGSTSHLFRLYIGHNWCDITKSCLNACLKLIFKVSKDKVSNVKLSVEHSGQVTITPFWMEGIFQIDFFFLSIIHQNRFVNKFEVRNRTYRLATRKSKGIKILQDIYEIQITLKKNCRDMIS